MQKFYLQVMERSDYVFGIHPVKEAIEAGKTIDKLLIKRELSGNLAKELIELARRYNIYIQKVPVEKLNKITTKNHQGVIGIISPIIYEDLDNVLIRLYEEGKTPLGILLDGVTDSRNFGAIARSAECAGANFIVIPERGSASATSDAVRASAGALFHIPVIRVKDLPGAMKTLHDHGYVLVGATEKGAKDYTKVDYTSPTAIIMGSEETGLSNEVIRKCDELAAIPILGKIGSLNVSVAAGIMLYETVRQRLSV